MNLWSPSDANEWNFPRWKYFGFEKFLGFFLPPKLVSTNFGQKICKNIFHFCKPIPPTSDWMKKQWFRHLNETAQGFREPIVVPARIPRCACLGFLFKPWGEESVRGTPTLQPGGGLSRNGGRKMSRDLKSRHYHCLLSKGGDWTGTTQSGQKGVSLTQPNLGGRGGFHDTPSP